MGFAKGENQTSIETGLPRGSFLMRCFKINGNHRDCILALDLVYSAPDDLREQCLQ
jgi:hypothetical protein